MTDFTDLTAGEKLTELGTDAEKWALALRDTLNVESVEVGILLPWFASAIENGRSAGYSDGVAAAKADVVVPPAPEPAEVPLKALKDYQYGETVDVYVMGVWTPGIIEYVDKNTGLVSVGTDRGPKSVMSTRSIRPRV